MAPRASACMVARARARRPVTTGRPDSAPARLRVGGSPRSLAGRRALARRARPTRRGGNRRRARRRLTNPSKESRVADRRPFDPASRSPPMTRSARPSQGRSKRVVQPLPRLSRLQLETCATASVGERPDRGPRHVDRGRGPASGGRLPRRRRLLPRRLHTDHHPRRRALPPAWYLTHAPGVPPRRVAHRQRRGDDAKE